MRRCHLHDLGDAGPVDGTGIAKVVYALAESDLRAMTGGDPENPTLALPCRDVFAAGQRATEVLGPFDVPGARAVHDGFWRS